MNYCLNPSDNGGEQVFLHTNIEDNGDGDAIISQELTVGSYGNLAKITLGCGAAFTPKKLREIANQIESEIAKKGLR